MKGGELILQSYRALQLAAHCSKLTLQRRSELPGETARVRPHQVYCGQIRAGEVLQRFYDQTETT